MSEADWEGYLPPDGTPCEGYIYAETANQGRPLNEWVPGVFIGKAYAANGGAMGLLKTEDGRVHAIGDFSFFRPMRTPEQIEAEEREKAVTEIFQVTGLRARDGGRIVAEAIYDAGYRRQEAQ
ncbi:hypothetical protein [Pseudomonas cremoricolorata]|uniref:Uncharacterized protein n=1 Tax=Pseudomonas cremoricolorata TaxID=157783 RepID=A0A089YFH7_9PSED|nr:hypothetical protein [Pseudomonas cremoricolorata]AIR90488.1 hypothetical protein LK03_14855 [Pseudomonas cremoricolorata]